MRSPPNTGMLFSYHIRRSLNPILNPASTPTQLHAFYLQQYAYKSFFISESLAGGAKLMKVNVRQRN